MENEASAVDAKQPKLKEPPWSQKAVTAALREKYAPPAWALLAGVSDGTGYSKSRTADAMAMSLWESRGLELLGFEIKSSRTDWLRELENPGKAEALCRYCDRWYLVTGDLKICRDGELPPTWGLIERRGGKLVVAKEAPKLSPAPFDRSFFAALLRRTQEQLDGYLLSAEERSRIHQQGRDQGREEGRKDQERFDKQSSAQVEERYERLKRAVDDFEAASGLRINGYTGGKDLGEDVKLVRTCRRHHMPLASWLEHLAKSMEIASAEIRSAVGSAGNPNESR